MNAPGREQEDAALIRAALAGDNNAFSALMSRHKEALYRFVRGYVGDAEEAFDLLQETFVACWIALDRFDAARPFPAWLRRIALNKCRDWSRRRQVRRFFFGAASLDAPGAAAMNAEITADDVGVERRLAELDAAVTALPGALREPLLLTTLGQLSHQEAARVLGISAKAVETRIYRAKQQLRTRLSLPASSD
jgi:RNA polymerase sigma-70 factor (ECF subfamily)